MGWDGLGVGVDLDFVNENFDVFGLRLDKLFSNSRICYPIRSLSSSPSEKYNGRNLQYRMSVHHMPVAKKCCLEIEILGQVIIYLLSECHSYLTNH